MPPQTRNVLERRLLQKWRRALDTAEKILRRWPDASVLMVSFLAYSDTIERAKSFGAKGFQVEPFNEEALAGALPDALKDGE